MKKKIANKIFDATIWAYANKLSVQILSTFVSIILARIIAPENYGVVSVALIFINFLNALVEPGLNSALVRKKNPESVDYSSLFYLNAIISFFLFLAVFVAAPFLENYWNLSGLSAVVRVLALKIPLTAISSIQHVYVQKNLLYKKNLIVSTLSTVLSAIIVIAMVMSGSGIWALVVNTLSKCVFDIVFAFVFIKWRPTAEFSAERLKELVSFGKNMLFSKIVDVAYVEFSAIVIGKKYTAVDLSFYNKGKSFPQMIMASIHGAVADVLFTVLSNEQDRITHIKHTMRKTIQISNYVMFPFLVGLMVCSTNFVLLFLTEKWISAVPYIQIMCLYNMFLPTSSAIYQAIKALGMSKVIFVLECIKKSIGCTLVVLTAVLFESPVFIALSLLLNIFISTVLDMIVSNKYLGYSFVMFIKDNYKIILVNVFMGLAVYVVGVIRVNAFAIFAIKVITGILVYIVGSYLLKITEFYTCINIIRSKLKR